MKNLESPAGQEIHEKNRFKRFKPFKPFSLSRSKGERDSSKHGKANPPLPPFAKREGLGGESAGARRPAVTSIHVQKPNGKPFNRPKFAATDKPQPVRYTAQNRPAFSV